MTTKLALILTGIVTLLVFAGCAGAFWFVSTKVPRNQQNERARMFGSGVGLVGVIAYGAIWLPWAVAYRKRRERQMEKDQEEAEDDERPRKKPRKKTRPD